MFKCWKWANCAVRQDPHSIGSIKDAVLWSLGRGQVRSCQGQPRPAGSALLVSGRHLEKKFKVFSPEIDSDELNKRRKILEIVLRRKGIKTDLNKIEADILLHKESTIKIAQLKQDKVELIKKLNSVGQGGSPGAEGQGGSPGADSLKNSLSELTEELQISREQLWLLEETSLLEYLKLPSCDESTILEDEVLFSSDKRTFHFEPLSHVQLVEKSGLAEFSVNSHTAYYLHAQLARLELKLTSYFQTILLHNNFNMFSNPDFSKSVVVEGCGSSQDDNQLFHLKSAQDFGSPVSGDAMYLVGGASKQPFVAYFARNLIQNPGILPVNLFSVGRQYNPVKSKESPVQSTESPVQSTESPVQSTESPVKSTESPVQSSESPVKSTENPEHSLTNTQQSSAVQVFSVCADKDMMMSQMNLLKDIMTEQLMKFGELRVVDRGVQHLGPSDIKKISFQLYLPGSKQFVEVGSLNVENDYYSRRMMIKQKQNGQYRNVYTVSGQMVNITKLLAVILENEQVDPCKPHQASTPLNLQVLQYLIDVVEFHVQDFNSPPNTPCSH